VPSCRTVVVIRLNDMTRDIRTQREATALAEAGMEVTVLALRSDGLPDVDDSGPFKLRRVANETTASWRSPATKLKQLRSRSRALADAACALRPSIVHGVDTDTLAVAIRVGKRTGARVIYDAGELYPDMLLANRAHVPAPVLAYWRAVERRFVPQADVVVTVGEAVGGEIRRRFGVEPVVIRSVPVLEAPAGRALLRDELGLAEHQVVLLYQGLINYGRALTDVIDAVAQVPDIVFAIQGYGPLLDSVVAHARDVGVSDRVRYMGVAPMDMLHAYASGADIGDVVLENVSLNNFFAAPNKLYQYLMAGIPVLGSDFPEIRRIVSEGDCGELCDPGSEQSIVDALRAFVALGPSARAAMGQRARHLAETRYNWDIEKAKLLEVYERLAARSTA